MVYDFFRNASKSISALYLSPKNSKVFVEKGTKGVYSISANYEKKCITVLISGTTSERMIPPLVINSNKRLPKEIVDRTPSG